MTTEPPMPAWLAPRMTHDRFRTGLVVLTSCALALSGCVAGGFAQGDTVREITMWVEAIDWEISPGVSTPVWAFCAEGDGVKPMWDGPCGVPAPTIHVNEGDVIRLTFVNTHSIPHTVHFHGWHPYASDFNGNPLLGETMVAEPGETQVIEWRAEPSGSFIFHCHFETPTHMEMGMYGAFIVEDLNELPSKRQDVVMVLDEWQIRDEPTFLGFIPDYNYFTINGKSFPLTQPILADVGEHVRLHVVNAGYTSHAMHIHGYTPDSWEGVAGADHAVRTDVRGVFPGQTVVMDFMADRPGVWLIHDHVVPSVTAGSDGSGFGTYPRGMLTVLAVGDEYQAALQELAPSLVAAARLDSKPSNHEDGAQESDPPQDTETEAVPTTYRTEMRGYQFEQNIRVPAGTTVEWKNADGAIHTVTAAHGSFDSGDMPAGATWSFLFEEPGTYEIYCRPHAYQADDGTWKGMVTTVVVE